MNARSAAVAVGLAVAIGHAAAQAQAPVARVAFLSPSSADAIPAYVDGFRQSLREQGFVDGANVVVDFRFANRRFGDLPAMAREIVKTKPDVIVAHVTEAAIAAREATRTIPIVMVGVGDPVALGLVDSLSRPGGNVTGSSGMTIETAGKTVGLLKDVVPAVKRVGVLWNPANATYQRQVLREVESAARNLALEVKLYSMADPATIEQSFASMSRDGVDGVVALSDPVIVAYAGRIAALAEKARLPSIAGLLPYADAGGMLAYGPDFGALFRDAAVPVARILRGTKPADMAVARPTRFEFVVNAKTARAIGVTVPASVALRADRIIE